ncbi:MAG: hypothetical protein NWF05_02305 [Candidatus Bathyarchaeota archaeon]|nr:hypothetical protein [Candidatus Bathyarchaeota archaeon]
MVHLEYLFDEDNGIILDKVTRSRCIILTKTRIDQILSTFIDEFQSASTPVITEAFRLAGKNFAEDVVETKKADFSRFLTVSAQRFTDGGLGKVEIVDFNQDVPEVKFRIWNNFLAEVTRQETLCCKCVTAFATGMCEGYLQKTPKIKETHCIKKGSPYCEWHLTI